MIDQAIAMAAPDNLAHIEATIHRYQALQAAVQIKAAKGEKAHTWLPGPK